MGFSDSLELAGKLVAVLTALVAAWRWLPRRRQRREEEELLNSLQRLLAERGGGAYGIQPEIGTREHRTAERLLVQGRLERRGTGYFLPQEVGVTERTEDG